MKIVKVLYCVRFVAYGSNLIKVYVFTCLCRGFPYCHSKCMAWLLLIDTHNYLIVTLNSLCHIEGCVSIVDFVYSMFVLIFCSPLP